MKNWLTQFRGAFVPVFNKFSGFTSLVCGKVCAVIAWILIVGAIALALSEVYGFTKPHIAKIYEHTYILAELNNKSIRNTDKEKNYIDHLVKEQRIIPASAVYKDTLDYYDSLIAVLVAMLGIFAFVSWFSMRSKVKEEMRDTIESGMKTGPFKDKLKDTIEDSVELYLKNSLSDHLADVPGLTDEQIRKIVSQEYELKADKIKEDVINTLKAELRPKEEQAVEVVAPGGNE